MIKETQRSVASMKKKAIYIITGCAMGVLLILSIIIAFYFGLVYESTNYFKLITAIAGVLFDAILFVSCCFNIRDDTHQGGIFAEVSVLLYFCLLMSGATDVLVGKSEARSAIIALQTMVAVCSTVTHFLFWRYQCASLPQNRAKRYFTLWIYVLLIAYLVMLVVNLFTGILFVVDESGNLISTGETLEFLFFSLFYLTFLLYIIPQRCSLRKKLSLASFAFFPILCIVLTAIWYAVGVIYTVSSITYIFLLMAAYVVFFCDYVESKEVVLKQKTELAEQEQRRTELQTTLMLSQMRPHFLYNAITAIRYLCKKDQNEAYESLGLFADYLRGNMDALSNGSSIPFEKELEHIKTYLMLEQIRFGDELAVEYDIGYSDFSLPALTVQPIVENAVRHGATMNKTGGKIILRSEKTESGAVITVIDNGPGFDVNAPINDGRNHFGLENVRNCLKAKKCGELQIESIIGKGTTVKIYIRR